MEEGKRSVVGRRVRSDFFHHTTGIADIDDSEKIYGDDWETTKYVTPSFQRAETNAVQAKFLQGRGSFWSADLKTTGTGVYLYFRLLERGILFFFFSSLAIVPSAYFMFSSMEQKSRASHGQQLLDDPLKLSQLSLGSLEGNTSVPLPWSPYEEVLPETIGLVVAGSDLVVVLLSM